MQQVRGRVGPANRLPTVDIDAQPDGCPGPHLALDEMAGMKNEPPVFLRIGHSKAKIIAGDFPRISDLSP